MHYNTIIHLITSSDLECYDAYLRGANSFGALLGQEGIRSIPSPSTRFPLKTKYFSGGFITKIYGSGIRGRIDAIQVYNIYKL